MFNSLKDKIKGWVSRGKEETEKATEEDKSPKEEEIKEGSQRKEMPEKKKDKEKAPTKKEIEKEPSREKQPAKKEKEEITKTPEKDLPEEKEKKRGFFRRRLTEEKFESLFEELEMILLQNNVAIEAIESIKESLKERLLGEDTKTDIESALRESIENILIDPPELTEKIKEKEKRPFVILFAGINGSGKTTTIAKIAHHLKENAISSCLASADTFRAAAIEQLNTHAERLNIPIIKKDYKSDPASVAFDAIKYAEKNNIDVVLIDTAGRMNNKDTLMKEIEKIARVNSPDLKIFLGESITGNDATRQAEDFNNAIGIDGIILSKADVDERGGTAISVSKVTKRPIYFLGTGQEYSDLEKFDKKRLIDKIFSTD